MSRTRVLPSCRAKVVNLEESQIDWMAERCINCSTLVRSLLAEYIAHQNQEQPKPEKRETSRGFECLRG